MKKNGLYAAWIIACLATLGSLYFGEIRNHIACALCWYQRIAMFPLAIILGIAAFRNDYRIISYVLPLSLLGLLFALIQVMLQYAPSSFLEAFCTGDTCVVKSSIFGAHELAFVSLIGFILLNTVLFMSRKR